ncbi:MAG TPA: universal stress protein [Ramlibacter sp.]|uniref:universal stress protein n=1 Tax=Ramlibacter sp. TaxID=1917967 RepID=UPI002D7F7099|nr:universal stress protein [Ramlibacter sp.]HET8746738.1 universal stress protein [Ramlibacter sp.]
MHAMVPRPAGRLPIPPETDAATRAGAVVAICAPSSAGVNATWRAALVARELGAPLHVLHPAPQPRVLARKASFLDELAQDIRQRTRVAVSVEPVAGDLLQEAVAASREAAMLVLPSVRGNPLREWIMGTQAERLIRLCRSPVLVVKRPALVGYRRVLVPVDLRDEAARLISAAGALSRGSRLEVLHAVDARDEKVLRGLDDSEQALRSFRQHRAQGAFLALHRLIGAAQVAQAGAEAAIEFGEASTTVLARARKWDAELMVIGKARRGLLAGWFLGRMTQAVLARAGADVLVHPGCGERAALHAARAVDLRLPPEPAS